MIELAFALAIFFAALAVLPAMLRWFKARRNGRMAGAAMMIGFAFSALFDPAKAQASEEIDRQKSRGGQRREAAGGDAALPPSKPDDCEE